ncbi:hypothetical protein OUY22_35755 [Nonomuraea sp. MCN248]|uniref:Secreted protein n=1 Tax=Nonomuraea corallina TaxID=2989783 RepID=A0ABT4SNH4_9ACTN|nr:hypothetical protein [Nonomuraea corallina]MDA0638796.1 hypothetical protein [Nonomuraea corallina]
MTVTPIPPAPPVPSAAAAPPSRHSVPGRIRALTATSVAALALLFAAVAAGAATAGDGLRLIGRDAGPQVVATSGLYFGLSDMDALIADVLALGTGDQTQRPQALARYERQRSAANLALLEAFQLAGDDQAERRTIQSVLDGLGRYEQLVARALLLDSQSSHAPGEPPASALGVYRDATDLMRQELLPQAYNLTLESGTIVRRTYDDTAGTLPLLMAAVIVAGLLALGCLVYLQVYLARRFRRVFGLALVGATLVTVGVAVAGLNVIQRDLDHLRTAKLEGFDPVVTLARARAIGYSMQGDQSRFLLDEERADTYEHRFLDASQRLLYVEAGSLVKYQIAVRKAGDFRGMLGSELAGATAEPALDAYLRYQEADTLMRTRAAAGRTGEAVTIRLGEVRQAFEKYDAELVKIAERKQSVFASAVDRGERALDELWAVLPFAAGAIGVLLALGVWPRLREYR